MLNEPSGAATALIRVSEGNLNLRREPIADQAFGDDAGRKRRGFNTLFFATTAGALLPLGHQHEVFGRFDVQLLAGLVANQLLVLSTLGADALFWRTGDNLFDPRQVGG